MTRWFEPITGRDLGHVTTWDFVIFLLKWDIWLLNSWYFSISGPADHTLLPIYQPIGPMKSGYSFGPRTSWCHTPGEFLHSSVETSALLNFGRNDAQLCKRWFEVKAVSKLRYVDLLQAVSLVLVSKELNHFGVIADLFRQIGGHISRFVLFCSFWRLFTI